MDTNTFKETLLAEQTLLEGELKNIALFNTETNQWEATPDTELMNQADDNDAADRFEDFEERTSMLTTLQSRLTDVKDALGKIAEGKFGMCETGEDHPIEADRLAANPAARTCKAHMND
jgi:RNA polymerase-binding transcription factor DksA